ncbi:MAG: hypothetical protein GQ574_18995 [Crocinitomix sp.]|nr:hypothetical protein [Crocinitomix sp.]
MFLSNKRTKIIGLGLVLLLLVIGFWIYSKQRSYSFFVAGHVYGSPLEESPRLYSPFLETFDDLNSDELMVHGFLTGDIVKNPNEESWTQVDKDLEGLKMPLDFAPGNHDLKDYDLYTERYGPIGRYFFLENDLFLIPEVQVDGWVISKNQITFFQNLVERNQDWIENIFVFVHQAIYIDYMHLSPNSFEGKTDAINFKSEVLPALEETNKPTYIFSGDVGAFDWGMSIFHEPMDNITYVASGMGGGVADNYLIIDVLNDKTVEFRIVSLQEADLGEIDDY